MKQKKYDLWIVLGSLVLFGFGVGLLHGDEKNNQLSNASLVSGISPNKVINELEGLLDSRSVQKVALILTQFSSSEMFTVLKKILDNPTSLLTHSDKIELVCALVTELERQENTVISLFDQLYIRPALFTESPPLLFVIAHTYYDQLLPRLVSYLEQKGKTQSVIRQMVEQALQYAIEHNNFATVIRLINRQLPLSSEQKNELLWYVVDHDKNPLLIPVLKKFGADPDTIINGRTPLLVAVAHNNKRMVVELINAGATVNKVASLEHGTALQEALSRKNTPIEMELRKHGARE